VPDERPLLLLLDGHSLAYRAFYALPPDLATSTGQVTNAVYGFTSMLIKLLADRQPAGVVVTFDQGRDVERTAAYPDYKAGREKAPDEFREQLPLIEQVMDVLSIPVVKVPGVEADDVIATLADMAVSDGWRVGIVTGDRDAMQLVTDDVTVLYNVRGISEVSEMTPDAVEDKYLVRPEHYVQYAALRGDKSDNLPGVPKVGRKTAAKLLDEYGSIDGIYDHIDDISGTVVPANLLEWEDQVRTNVRIMRLRRDVDLDVTLGDLRRRDHDPERTRELFGVLEFRALYDRFLADVLGEAEEDQAAAFTKEPQRLDAGGLAAWLDRVDGPVAVVCSTSSQVPHLVLEAVAVAHADRDPASVPTADMSDDDRAALAALLADPERPVVTHGAKTLLHVAAGEGWSVEGVTIDTELAAYLCNPEQRSFDLDRISVQYLQRSIEVEDDADGTGDQLSLEVEPDPWAERALRAEATRQLAEHLAGLLAEFEQTDLLRDVELPLVAVLQSMEAAGIAVDRHVLAELHDQLAERADRLEAEVHDHAGRAFNVGSGKQLQEVLFDDLGLPRTRKIKTGWSTAHDELMKIAGQHPIIEAVLEWRECTKLLSTYVDALPPLVDDETGRIHTTLTQTVAATGRLSSSNPNLQNIPVRTAEGREIRRAFVAGEDYATFLVADYSQIELRVMAHLSGDDGLLDAFRSGEDIHATTAARVFDLPLDEVDGTLRDRAKAVNYGLAYGLTPYGLAQQLQIDPAEASQIVDAYMDRFPGISGFLTAAVEQARRDGFTTTMFGRRRYLPDLLSGNRNRREMAERMALNAPIQGTAADIIKLAMIAVADGLRELGGASRQLLQVHDELMLEIAPGELEAVEAMVVGRMAGVADLAVPLEVDTATGTTWFDAQKH
jgi:DNA polymerase-1